MKKFFSIIFTLLYLMPAADAQEKSTIPVRDLNHNRPDHNLCGGVRKDNSLQAGRHTQAVYFIDGQLIMPSIPNPRLRLLPVNYQAWSPIYIDGSRPGNSSAVFYLLDGNLFLPWEAFTGEQPMQQRFPALYNIYHEADFKYLSLATFLERLPELRPQ